MRARATIDDFKDKADTKTVEKAMVKERVRDGKTMWGEGNGKRTVHGSPW